MDILEKVRAPPETAHIVRVTFRRCSSGIYAFTVWDAASGAVIGRFLRGHGPGGTPPRVELADVLGAIDGAYSGGCLLIKMKCGNSARTAVKHDRAFAPLQAV